MLKRRYLCPFILGSLLGSLCLSPAAFAFIPFFNQDQKPDILEVGLTGGLFKLTPDFRIYGTQRRGNPILISTTDSSVLKVNPRYRAGWGIDMTYGGDYKFNALYFETHNRKSQSNAGVIGVVLTPAAWLQSSATSVSSTLDSKYKLGTVAVSNPFTFSCFTIMPSLGLSYLYLSHNQQTTYAGINDAPTTQATVNVNSNFRGVGPSFAANFGYEFCGGFSLLGGLQYTPFLGDINGVYSALNSAPIAGANNNINLSYKTQSILLNHVQSELGFGYVKPLDKCITLNLTVVYRFVKMVGSRETNFLIDSAASSLLNNQVSNSVLHGPLLRVAIKYKLGDSKKE